MTQAKEGKERKNDEVTERTREQKKKTKSD